MLIKGMRMRTMSTRVWWGMLVKTVSDWDADKGPQKGAALAYYALFSLAPLMLIAMALAGIVVGDEGIRDYVMAQMQGFIGRESALSIAELMRSVSRSMSSRAASGIGVLLLLLGASGVVGELRSSLNEIWRVRPRESSLAIHLETQLISLAVTLSVGLLLIVSLLLSAFAAALETQIARKVPLPPCVLQGVNMAGSFALITFLFAMIYKFLPGTGVRWHDVWAGAAATALMLTIGNSFLGIYLGKFSGASAYGAAGAVVLILAWTYYCAQILYLGAEFTRVYAETREARK